CLAEAETGKRRLPRRGVRGEVRRRGGEEQADLRPGEVLDEVPNVPVVRDSRQHEDEGGDEDGNPEPAAERGSPREPPARLRRGGRRRLGHCDGAVASASARVTALVHAPLFCAAVSIPDACDSSTSTTAALLPGSSRSATARSNSSVIPRS